jgi:hypothetical protein
MNGSRHVAGHLAEKCGAVVLDTAVVLIVILGISNWAGWL